MDKFQRDRDELINLPGVGRKTANVVVSVAFGVPAIAVDTHVERVSKRFAICRWKDSVLEVEKTLMKKVPRDRMVYYPSSDDFFWQISL